MTTVEDSITHDSEGQIRDEEECSQEAFKEDEVELARAEMRQVREENARLKMLLEKIEDDYKSLQMRFLPNKCNDSDDDENVSPPGNEEHQLVALCLGRSCPSDPIIKTKEKQIQQQIFPHLKKEGDLKLCLNSFEDSKTDPAAVEVQTDPSTVNSALLETKEEEGRETWPPSKALKAIITSSGGSGADDLSQAGIKRARVSVRTRCDTPTMNDGCPWRKYGQKIAKGNPCPRAYYRCTVAPSCPVRKQVQRCAEDMSILISTYEGTHNHPLPISATAMASTTSAAASMLLSGSSSTSQPASNNLSSTLTGLNVNLSDISKSRTYYLLNSSPPSYTTITLDFTNDPFTTSSQFKKFSSFGSHQSTSRLLTSTRSLSFASSQPRVLSSSTWANTGSLSYGANAIPYSNNHVMGSFQSRRTSQEHVYQLPLMQKDYQAAVPSQQALTETLTQAITSDPSFRPVLAAAITKMVGEGASTVSASAAQANNNKVEGFGKMFKWDEQTALGTKGKGCASSLQRASMRKQQPQGPKQPSFAISNAAAPATSSENVEQTSRMLLE